MDGKNILFKFAKDKMFKGKVVKKFKRELRKLLKK